LKVKRFFFEKRSKKLFHAVARSAGQRRNKTGKSFLVLFFKKELPFYACLPSATKVPFMSLSTNGQHCRLAWR